MVIPTKVYIGNLPENCEKQALLQEFEAYGRIVEFDIVKNYAFAHFEKMDDAKEAVEALDGKEFNGNFIKVELSRSRVRQQPGMGGKNECFRCGNAGHWSKECPKNPNRERDYDGYRRPGRRRDYERDPYGPPDRYDRDPYADYYRGRLPPPSLDRYHPYDLYDRRRLPSRDPYGESGRDPYARPPPDYYSARPSASREALLELLLERAYSRLPGPSLAGPAGRASQGMPGGPPPRPRPGPY
jgi:RNA-binding protein 4